MDLRLRDNAALVFGRRYGQPEECEDAVAFLASVCTSFLTSSVLLVDG